MISIFPHSVIGRELDKQDDHFLFDTSIQGEVEACQILEDTSFPISELDTPSNLQVIVEDGPINSRGLRWKQSITLLLEQAYLEKQNRRDSLGKNRVRGKVKEFVKIFNQEVPEKPNFDLNDSQHQDSRRKERSKFRTEDTINEKMHSNIVYEKNMPECFNPGTLLKMILHLFCQILATTDTIR
ncbi:hypothetical protein NC652_011817 [Populus alba x Populus x berolinensis]|uniref:Uncharacterized protein n=1 Tax=Populus tomentosa TaxID=118781 RepID=A0A8X8D8Q9_POPTO|nr:hypothetical protein POTOM_016144 [Populus tomentosa]KAJ6937284.1 hypothetical protein NC652_011817 [Populus alba x Populus x berolinensis]